MSQLKELKNKLLTEQIQEQIYQYILDSNLPIGAKLPNEFTLGEQFGVGRSTIREAVKILVSRGVLQVKQGSGTYVARTSLEEDPLGLGEIQDKISLALDLADVRMILEPGIAELAALHATKKDIETLTSLCEQIEEKIKKDLPYSEEDIAFHVCVAECSKNKVIQQLLPIIDTAVMMFVNVTHRKLREETIETHRALVEAIKEGDTVGARAAMTMHMTYNRNRIKQLARENKQVIR